MIAGLSLSSCCGVTPFNVSTPISNPLLPKARTKNTTAYTRNIRAPNTMRPAPFRKDCSLDIVSSLVSTTLRALRPIAAHEYPTRINGHVLSHPNFALEPPEDTLEGVAEGAFECVAGRRSLPVLRPLRP